MHTEKGTERLVLNNTTPDALNRYAISLGWPQDLELKYSSYQASSHIDFLTKYFADTKGTGGLADFLAQCNEEDIPQWLRDAAFKLKEVCIPAAVAVDVVNAQVELAAEVSDDGTY